MDGDKPGDNLGVIKTKKTPSRRKARMTLACDWSDRMVGTVLRERLFGQGASNATPAVMFRHTTGGEELCIMLLPVQAVRKAELGAFLPFARKLA